MEKKIEYIISKLKCLLNADFVTFEHVKAKHNVTGVYMVYNHQEELIYIGSTNKFHVRFGTDLMNETTHTLVKKMMVKYDFKNRPSYQDYVKNKCRYRIAECLSKREAEAIEHLAIFIMNPPLNQ